MRKKLLVSLLVGITFLFSLGPLSAAKAQTTWYNQGFVDWYSKVYDQSVSPSSEIFGERYTAAQVQWILYSLPSTVLNLIPGNPDLFLCVIGGSVNIDNCLGTLDEGLQNVINPKTTQAQPDKGLASTYLDMVSQSQLSGIGYFNNLFHKLSPVSSVKAADNGTGFSVGQSMVSLWRITRNLSYSLLVIAIVIIAFMIMFRVKINPQTVITIQSALPKLIVSMILITFSYAIAGFLIDLMYVVIGLIATIISTGGLSALDPAKLFNEFLYTYDGFGIMYSYWVHFVMNAFLSIFDSGNMWWAGIVALLFSVFSILAILFWSFKIIFVMVKNFAMLMISIISAPLEIMIGSITNKVGFGSWLRRMTSYLAVYPVMIIMIFFSFFFLKQGIVNEDPVSGQLPRVAQSTPFRPYVNVITSNTWNPPFGIGTGASHNGSQLIWVLVSFFIFSQITKVVEIVQSLFSGKPFDYGTGIGEAWGRIQGAYGSTLGPQVDAIRKYGSEVGARNFYRDLNSRIDPTATGKPSKLPKWLQEYIGDRANPDRRK